MKRELIILIQESQQQNMNCSNTYQDPRILSCLHSYCVQCITKLHVEDTTSIICPTCNHSTTLPDGSVTSLPRNIRLKRLSKTQSYLK